MTTATKTDRRNLVEGLPSIVLKFSIGDASHPHTMTLRNGNVIPEISSGYIGAAVLDAIGAIVDDKYSRGRTYEVLIRGETK